MIMVTTTIMIMTTITTTITTKPGGRTVVARVRSAMHWNGALPPSLGCRLSQKNVVCP